MERFTFMENIIFGRRHIIYIGGDHKSLYRIKLVGFLYGDLELLEMSQFS